MDRLLPLDLLRGHLKVIAERDESGRQPKPWIRSVLVAFIYVLPVVLGLITATTNTTVHAPGGLLASTSLVSIGALSAFTQLSSLRQKLTERSKAYEVAEAADRSMMDESATHLLMCAMAAMLSAASIVCGMLWSDQQNAEYSGFMAGVSICLTAWTGTILWIAMPRLYTTYVQHHEVPCHLSGKHTGPPA